MEGRSPLDTPELRAIDECLSRGELHRAQQLLGELGSAGEHGEATTYLATRLLYLRDRLDPQSVAERLEELLRHAGPFPEAEALFRAASRGIPGPRSIPPPAPSQTALALEIALESPANDAVPPSDRPTATDPLAQTGNAPVKIVVDTRHGAEAPTPVANPLPALASKRPGVYSMHTKSTAPRRSSRAATGSASANPGQVAIPAAARVPRIESVPPAPHTPRAASSGHSEPPRSSGPPSSMRPLAALSDPRELWPADELAVFAGDVHPALESFTRAARSQLSHLPQTTPGRELELLGLNGAELLNKAAVTHHFAPFDLSLHSLSRLEAAIATLCGMQPVFEPDSAVELLLGSYIGEVLRLSHRGEWVGAATDPGNARVRAGSYSWRPFVSAHHWLASGGRTSLIGELTTGLARPGTVAWKSYASVKIAPRALWQGQPETDELGVLGEAVQSSVLARACELLYAHALDGSIASLDALEQLLRTLVASAHPLTGKEPWLQRLVLLGGAYLGWVVGAEAPGQWLSDPVEPIGARYKLRLPSGKEVTPMSHILFRAITQRPLDLELFANLSLNRGL